MKSLLIMRLALLVVLLSGGWQSAVGQQGGALLRNALRSSVSGTVAEKTKFAKTWSKFMATVLVAGGLMLGNPQAVVQAQDEEAVQEDPNAAWMDEVEEGIYNSVVYMALRNPDYDHLHHGIYIGDTITGEPLFAGLYLVGHEADYIRLYDRNGLVAQGFEQRDVEVFSDPLDGYSEVRIFTIKDINLQEAYEPIVPSPYPINEIGKELEMLAYGINEQDPESLFDLPLMRRSCKIVNPQGWANAGVGLHNCVPMDGAAHSFFGAPIFRDGKLVAFNAGKTRTAYSAEGTTQEFLDYVWEQQVNPTAVSAEGKLPTTWAEIKAGF